MDNSTSLTTANLTRICRVCLIAHEEMHSLFSFMQFEANLKKPVYLSEMFMSISSMKISPKDRLPTKVCTNCKQLAHTSYTFQQQCNRSQEALDSYLSDKQFCVEEDPLNLENEENTLSSRCDTSEFIDIAVVKMEADDDSPYTEVASGKNEEICEDSGSLDNVCVKSEVDTLEDDVLLQQELTVKQLEGTEFGNSSDTSEVLQSSGGPSLDGDAEIKACSNKDVRGETDVPCKKSRKHYETVYNNFMKWRQTNNITCFSENTFLVYFKELAKKYKSSTLWCNYSMLKSTLNVKHGLDLEAYRKVRALLKRTAEGYQPKKSEAFTGEEINKFINEAPDTKYLPTKVALIMGIMGACRANELHAMKIEDLKFFDGCIQVSIPYRTKFPRNFTVTGSFYDIVKKYADLRPPDAPTDSFFLNFQNGKCIKQIIGINKFGTMGKGIAKFLELPNPERYTGHCLRRSSRTLGVNMGVAQTVLKRHGGLESERNKLDAAKKTLPPIKPKPVANLGAKPYVFTSGSTVIGGTSSTMNHVNFDQATMPYVILACSNIASNSANK